MRAINPDLWWLLLLALVPVLIHLLIRQRLPRVRWAAMTFLMAALKKNRKKLLLETILLLIVRTAIVIAMVLVVVRPVVRAASTWLRADQQRLISVIVLDDSAGMAATDGVSSRLARAVARINQYLDELPGGSEAALVLGASPPSPSIRQPTRDMPYVRQVLARLNARDSAGSLGMAVQQAAELLSQVKTPRCQIVVVTDAQSADWRRQQPELATAFETAGKVASILVLTIPSTSPANVSISGLSVAAGSRDQIPGLVTTLWPTPIDVTVQGHHLSSPVETHVELLVAGQKVGRRRVLVDPAVPTTVSFEHRFNSLGDHAVTAQCDSDLFDRDNQRSVVVHVRQRVGVLMLDGRPGPDPFATATGFLRVAIWPPAGDEAETVSPFDIQVVSAANLESVQFSEFPLIVAADIGALPETALRQIKAAVRSGAGLLVVAGPQVTPAGFGAMWADGGQGPLPLTLGAPIDRPAEADALGIKLVSPLPAALAAFEDSSLQQALAQVECRRLWPVAGSSASSVQHWAEFSEGGAALVVHDHGLGRAAYFGASMDRQGGEFPLSPAFVPFAQQVVAWLLAGGQPSAVVAGGQLAWSVRGAREATLIFPDGTSEPAEGRYLQDGADGLQTVVVRGADRAGVYSLRYRTSDNRLVQMRRAVVTDAEESDLIMLDADALRREVALRHVSLVPPGESLRSAIRATEGGSELWMVGLLVLFALIAVEMLLVYWFAPKQVDTEAVLQRAMRL